MRSLLPVIAAALPTAWAAEFETTVRPFLETRCLACHREENKLGELGLETLEAARRGGIGGPAIVPGNPGASPLYLRLALSAGEPGAMPPSGPRASADEMEAVREWILAGAAWESELGRAATEGHAPGNGAELALAQRIHARVRAQEEEAGDAAFGPYAETVPGTSVALQMAPIPAGEFTLGTPAGEPGRGPDEGPQRRVRVDAFWMGTHEVSWDAFRPFMLREAAGYADPDGVAAAVSSPTPPYVEMSFGMGITGYPAISMTQHAASKYAQWLSAKTGRFYRLPTEAEWEYACRAGGSAAYSFGDDAGRLPEFGWFWGNSDGQYRQTGTRQPNPWGLFDMHGNVWEWTLDGHLPAYPAGDGLLVNPWTRADRLYPRVVRGGSWMDDAPALRCGARRASEAAWKMQDPQLPKSIWYHTDAQWLGFRLVRPRQLPSPADMHAYWNSASGEN